MNFNSTKLKEVKITLSLFCVCRCSSNFLSVVAIKMLIVILNFNTFCFPWELLWRHFCKILTFSNFIFVLLLGSFSGWTLSCVWWLWVIQGLYCRLVYKSCSCSEALCVLTPFNCIMSELEAEVHSCLISGTAGCVLPQSRMTPVLSGWVPAGAEEALSGCTWPACSTGWTLDWEWASSQSDVSCVRWRTLSSSHRWVSVNLFRVIS